MLPSEVLASLLSLCAAASWGASDFSGAVATRAADALRVVRIAHAAGLVFLLALAVAAGEPWPTGAAVAWGAASGLAGACGLAAFYRALSIGKMGINAPVAAVLTAAVPVAFGASTQGMPSAVQLGGFAVALAAIWLVARPEGALGRPRGLGHAIVAGACFGAVLLFSRLAAATASVYGPLAAARVASVAVLSVVLLARRPAAAPRGGATVAYAAVAGVLDALGIALFVLATHRGRIDVAAVLSSLYPAVTVLLARFVLKEHVSRAQLAGMVAALAAVTMIAR